jgi:Xaa-Pro aminopeptidase
VDLHNSSALRSPFRRDRGDEAARKVAAVRTLMSDRGLQAVVLRLPANHAWLSAGGRSDIIDVSSPGIADLIVTHEDVALVTHVNEVDRLLDEEFSALTPTATVLQWSADRRDHLPDGPATGWDVPDHPPGALFIGADLTDLRCHLTTEEIERAEVLGRDTAESMTDALLDTNPRMSEYDAIARMTGHLLARGIEPVVLLAAGGERLARHRHPLPTLEALGSLAMVVTCARRDGLIINATRFVSHGPLPASHREILQRLLQVDAAFNAGTTSGRSLGAVFTDGINAYGTAGFAHDEWQNHHQGGLAGYLPREEVATQSSGTLISHGQLFSWNPSAAGLKIEDTILTTPAGPQVLTVDPRWPSTTVEGMIRPLILEAT